MTEKEFLRLGICSVVSNKKGRLFVIYDDDVMGSAHRGREHAVYAAEALEGGLPSNIRIDKGNYVFYSIEGKMKMEDLESFLDIEKQQ